MKITETTVREAEGEYEVEMKLGCIDGEHVQLRVRLPALTTANVHLQELQKVALSRARDALLDASSDLPSS
ncbi:MAG: hypothetical protein FH759_08525 [Sediminimonas qiaohouensis]|uniref:Uncharacterized protein n=1 Tax=Sediminimonas qiaohouensis TaxID=552061 RepID=A0A7C9M985_9RHOB|nr:hypothetical protein [Sediminimonas qiaohouensis]MTJ04721.1 hypothetical protein [Sediminimonas qiaohouensis]